MKWIVKAGELYWARRENSIGAWQPYQCLAYRYPTRADALLQLRYLGHPHKRVVRLMERGSAEARKDGE